jgi:hypothetical protein
MKITIISQAAYSNNQLIIYEVNNNHNNNKCKTKIAYKLQLISCSRGIAPRTSYIIELRTRWYQTLNTNLCRVSKLHKLESSIFRIVNNQFICEPCRLQQNMIILKNIEYFDSGVRFRKIWHVINSKQFSPGIFVSIFLHNPNMVAHKQLDNTPKAPKLKLYTSTAPQSGNKSSW